MFDKIYLRLDQLYSAFLFFASWVCSWFYPKQKGLWVIAERKTEARDNGYWVFRYIVENHPEANVRYVIKKDSPDYQKLLPWKDKVVEASSFTHYMLMWKVKYAVSTHFHTYFPYRVNLQIFINILKRLNRQCRLVWLQHGVIKDDHPGLHENPINIDMFVCGAKPEFDFVSNTFNYPSGIIQYTGLARFDQLHNVYVNKNQILVMPTWRHWLNDENFSTSEYYTTFCQILKNENLQHLLSEYNAKLVFYPHFKCQRFVSLFRDLKLPDNIVVADSAHYDVQQLLKESALMVTDYSSVFWDFAYMKKPIIYFQFDEKDFRDGHYPQGYYDYHNGLGEWTASIEELIPTIERYLSNEMKSPTAFTDKHSMYFPLYDTKNCQRIYDKIIKLK